MVPKVYKKIRKIKVSTTTFRLHIKVRIPLLNSLSFAGHDSGLNKNYKSVLRLSTSAVDISIFTGAAPESCKSVISLSAAISPI